MDAYNSIIQKLSDHMIAKLGFSKDEHGLHKELHIEDFCMTNRVVRLIMERKAYPSTDPYEALTRLLIENYVGAIIMERALDDEIDLTDEEWEYFECNEDADEAEDIAEEHYSNVEYWVSQQDITVNADELKKYVDACLNNERLDDEEYNVLNKIATKTHMDCWFWLETDADGKDYVENLEEECRISLKDGIEELTEGIVSYALCDLTEYEIRVFEELLERLNITAEIPRT